jgi:hypothetical protein
MRNKENVTLFVQRSTPRTAKKFLKGKFPHSMLKSGKISTLIDWVHLNLRSCPRLYSQQNSTFEGGGCLLGISVSHTVADPTSFVQFLQTWANLAGGDVLSLNGIENKSLAFDFVALAHTIGYVLTHHLCLCYKARRHCLSSQTLIASTS